MVEYAAVLALVVLVLAGIATEALPQVVQALSNVLNEAVGGL